MDKAKKYLFNKIDKAILGLLDKNSRASLTTLSHNLGLSKQVVSYRIGKMRRNNILELFSAIINKSKLGFFYCQLYLKFKEPTEEETLMKKLPKINGLHWVAEVEGNYDLAIFFLAKSFYEYHQIYKNIQKVFASNIARKDILLTQKTYYLNHSFITGEPRRIGLSEFPTGEVKLSERDLRLINSLKENARIQTKELARLTKMTPQTVRQRLAYLIRKKMILGFRMRINQDALGYKRYILFFTIPNSKTIEKDRLKNFLIKLPNIIRLQEVSGKWDFVCDLVLSKENTPKKYLNSQKQHFLNPMLVLQIKRVLQINTFLYH
jgi:DNA-binding Lrp family transcriptional regulator